MTIQKNTLPLPRQLFDFKRMNLTRTSLLAAAFLSLNLTGSLAEAADKKICVLADTHVMDPSLVDDNNNKLWQEYLSTSKTMQDLSASIFDILVEKIILEKPDLLLIVGDLTKDSEVLSHEYVLKRLTKIKDFGIKTYVIPGNHDRGWMERALIFANDTCMKAETIDNDGFALRYADYGYGSDTEQYGSTLNYVVEPFSGLTLLCVDSGIWVTYRDGSIDWICDKAKEAMAKGNQVLLMVHHPIMPHYYYQNKIFDLSIAEDYEEVREKLVNAGIKVVLTGHSHASDISRYVSPEGKEIYDICTGSPISYPCDYRILTFDNTFSNLKVSTKSLTELEGYNDFPTYAKGRLKESIYNWTSNWFREKIGYDEDYDLIISVMSQALSNAFTIHALGNEPDNPDTQESVKIYNDILRYLPKFELQNADLVEDISYSMKSLLGDYPSEDDKENVINDRDLSITMPVLTNGIKEIKIEKAIDSKWFTLQGLQLSEKPSVSGIYIQKGKKVYVK